MGNSRPRFRAISTPMLAASETRPALERLLDFDLLDEAWPRGRTAIERAEIGRRREDALSGVAALRDRIITSRAETMAGAAVQLRRLAVEAEAEGSSVHEMLAEPDMRRLVASVLAVGEREADAA